MPCILCDGNCTDPSDCKTRMEQNRMAVAEDYATTMRRQAAAMPRLKFVCERDWMSGPSNYAVGFLWGKNLDAEPGEFIYRKRLLLRLTFRLWLERWT